MECKFQVGDKVVCVDASLTNDEEYGPQLIYEGEIYTVTNISFAVCRLRGRVVVIELLEIDRGAPDYNAYYFGRFRPAEDIEQFRRLVAKLPTNLELVE